jgi:hypothetical protein
MTSPADAIKSAVQSVTKDWAKQKKAEERNRNAVFNRRLRLVQSHRVTIREVAFEVMDQAYRKASDNGTLPTKPRQIMYAARPEILTRTGETELNSSYFSQTLLIDYMEEYDCDDWDIIWDARGHFIEPHTGTEIPLGTLEVRQYLGERPSFKAVTRETVLAVVERLHAKGKDASPTAVMKEIASSETAESPKVALNLPFPTNAAENRFDNILFIEKEGFHPILEAAQMQQRWDVALMSTKGMSVTASRKLLDELSPYVERIFVLHDFDRSGFSICGTLGTDSRRYFFNNDITDKFVDIGLRLEDVAGLQSEPVPPIADYEWRQRAATLRRHGATPEEIVFLRSRRVELNALTSRQLVDFIEAKFKQHGVKKVIPGDVVLEQQARRVIAQHLTKDALAKINEQLAKQASAVTLPADLAQRVAVLLEERPELPWDLAVAEIVSNPRLVAKS